jgi:hypothetical protein
MRVWSHSRRFGGIVRNNLELFTNQCRGIEEFDIRQLRVYGCIYMSEPCVVPTVGSATSNPFTNVCSCKFYDTLVCCPFQCSPGFG